MASVIRQIPNWDTITDSALLAATLAATTTNNPKKWKLPDLQAALTAQEFRAFRLTLAALSVPPPNPTEDQKYQAVQFADAAAMLQIDGFDLSTNASQFIIQAMSSLANPPWPAGLATKMLQLGRPVNPWWITVDIEAEPTQQDVIEWRVTELTKIARDQIRDRINAVSLAAAQAETPEAVLADAEASWLGGA